MQPLYEVTVARPWHWGIAILSAPGAPVPESLDQTLVTATPDAIVMKVRHAQDIDVERFEGDWDWAVATIQLRSMTDFESDPETPVYEGLLRLPGGRLAIGDADSEVVLNDLGELTRVRVFALDGPTDSAIEVRVDLTPLTS